MTQRMINNISNTFRPLREVRRVFLLALLVMGALPMWAQTHTEQYDFDGDDVLETYNVVYLDVVNGDDGKDGSASDKAVKTWGRAYKLLPNYTGTTDADRDVAWDSNIIVLVDKTSTSTSNFTITEANAKGNGTKGIPATITGVWPWTDVDGAKVKNGGRIYLGGVNGVSRIGADTKFKYVRFAGGANTYLNLHLFNTTFDVGCSMDDISAYLAPGNGALKENTAPDLHIMMYDDTHDFSSKPWPNPTKPMKLTIRSGKFGRILSCRTTGTSNDQIGKRYVMGTPEYPLMGIMELDIDPIENAKWNTNNKITHDIAFCCAGSTQGTEYCDIRYDIKRAKIGKLVAATQGMNIKAAEDFGLSCSSFFGRTVINLIPAGWETGTHNNNDIIIEQYYGACLGRSGTSSGMCNAAFYGTSQLNMYGGTINSGAYLSAGGISGLKSPDGKYGTTDKFIPYPDNGAKYASYPFNGIRYQPYDANKTIVEFTTRMDGTEKKINLANTVTEFNIYGGVINGGLYGGSYGYSDVLEVAYALPGAGSMWGTTNVNIYGGTINGGVYGGGMGSTTFYNDAASGKKSGFLTVASVYGNTNVNIYGGNISGGIYGGGKGVEAVGAVGAETEFLNIAKVYGTTNVTINPTDPSWTYNGNIYGGGAMGAVEGATNVTILGGNITGNVFAGGLGEDGHVNKAKVTGNTEANIKGGTQGSEYAVYGGAQMAQVVGNTTVNLLGGIVGSAYGGGLGTETMAANITGNTQVNLGAMEDDGEGNLIATGNATANNIFGCNNLNGAPSGTVTVNTISGTINNNVYGGGNQAAASVSPVVNINGGTITESVYGGGYGATAVITGNPTVNVTNGTVTENVFGGGSLANTDGSTTIAVSGGTITNDVYGGGALANVTGNTTVNLTGGTIGNSYGGGLGSNEVTALVGGNATTTLKGSKVTGSIFGANNVNGTPQGHVKVHVLATTPREGQTAGQYDVAAVYGGGNQAAYVPSQATFDANKGYTEVLIESCDNSIDYVYGGGNAAPVPATDVTIYGADSINYAFAGGNGAGVGNPGADIGYLDYTRDEEHKYGSGESHITIYGGTVNNVFGGSNTLGYIRTHTYVNLPEFPEDYQGDKCELRVGEMYVGGNEAEMYCKGTMTFACSDGAAAIYGGSKSANYHGDVDMVINSGTYGKVFGGNNLSGNIFGHIHVTIDETGCYPIIIGELYGCGNQAPYSVYGYNNDGTVKTSGKKQYSDPVIDVISCTQIGKIFGGGLGVKAVVYGDPTVNINPIKGVFAGQRPTPPYILDGSNNRLPNDRTLDIPDAVGTIGNIYGGGNQAAVYGNPTLNIGNLVTNKHLNAAQDAPVDAVDAIISGNIYGGGSQADVNGNTKVNIQAGTIIGNVYGGGEGVEGDPAAAKVTGTTKVIIGE